MPSPFRRGKSSPRGLPAGCALGEDCVRVYSFVNAVEEETRQIVAADPLLGCGTSAS